MGVGVSYFLFVDTLFRTMDNKVGNFSENIGRMSKGVEMKMTIGYWLEKISGKKSKE